ncbi:MAG: hypothetical protein Q4Q32_00250 [Methanobrevibacter sp.]|nr:hypothetical protein [Methanobrevibacter sp.]
MNFKRMNFLLIMLALVLLVGIGSVSAASDDGTDIISDGITDDMLLDDGVTENTDSSDPTEPGDSTDPVAEKINTTVESANVTARDNETASIPVTVKDNESKNITVTENDFSVSEGDKSLNFTYNGTINLVDKLDLGNHTLIIAYLGNDTYAASNTTITLSIFGNETLNAPDTVIVDKDGNVEIPITVTNGVNETAVTQENITITLTKNGVNFPITDVVDSKINLELGNDFINAVLTVVYNENNYTKTIAIKKGSNVTVENEAINFNITDQFIIPVNFTDLNSEGLTVNKSDIVVSEGKKALNFTYADSNIKITNNLTAGVHNITIFYKGNGTYGNATANVILNIYKNMTLEAPSSIDVNTTKNATISFNLTNGIDYLNLTKEDIDNKNLTVVVTYLNETNETVVANISNLEIADGVITFTLDNNNFTSGNVTISVNKTYNATVTLNNIINVIITPVNTNGSYQSGNLTFKVTDADGETDLTNKTVNAGFYVKVGSIRFGLSSSLTIDENGIASFNLNTEKFSTLYYFLGSNYIPVGDYNFTISGEGQLKGNATANVTIEKADVNITANKFTGDYGTTEKFKITVTSAAGELMKDIHLQLYMPQTSGKYYNVTTNENGTCEITVSGLVGGDYNVTVSTIDNNTNNASKNSSIVINKVKVKIDTSSKTMYYNSGSTAKITIKNAKTGKAVAGVYVFVRLYTSSTKYNDYLFMTNSKGVVEFSAPLDVGKHKMIVATADTRYEGSSVTKTITVKNAPAKITAAKKTAYYKQGKYFVVKVTNTKNNKPIYNAKLNIRVFVTSTKYYNFNGRTGANGQIKLSMDLKPGTYNVVIIDKDSNMVAKQATSKMVIKKAPAKFSAPKVTAKKKANKYFKVKVINKKTKKIIPGVKVKVKVYTGKKSKTYTIKTNSKGIAKLSTKSLKVGNHKVVITSANKYVKASKKTSSIKITK